MSKKEIILKKENMQQFLKELPYQVFVPIMKDNVISFEALEGDKNENDIEEIELSRNTTKSPKEIIFPQTETFFKFNKVGKEVKLEISEEKGEKKAIFGIRPCDAKSFSILDNVFKEDYEDTFYWDKRKNLLSIGLACNEPSINCFCTSFDISPYSKENVDMLLTDIGDKYYVEVVTEEGSEVIDKDSISNFFTMPTEDDRKMKEELHKNAVEKIKRGINKEGIKKLDDISMFKGKIWEEISKKCLSCGICTFLCPTCHCFDIQDETMVVRGRRVRIWDSCMFPEYTLEASGHNPRPTRRERLRNRIYHKYKWYPENFGEIACVGCGRCIEKCPANIDIIEIINSGAS